MALRELVGGLMEGATVKRVFGQPVERDGVTVIPVADVRGGFGGGEAAPVGPGAGAGAASGAAETASAAESHPASWGGGGMWSASPAGAYVLKDGEVSWLPAVNANRTVLLGCLAGIVSMLVIRSIVRTLVKRS
jgi:uncharacterized spore protein YtfJ